MSHPNTAASLHCFVWQFAAHSPTLHRLIRYYAAQPRGIAYNLTNLISPWLDELTRERWGSPSRSRGRRSAGCSTSSGRCGTPAQRSAPIHTPYNAAAHPLCKSANAYMEVVAARLVFAKATHILALSRDVGLSWPPVQPRHWQTPCRSMHPGLSSIANLSVPGSTPTKMGFLPLRSGSKLHA